MPGPSSITSIVTPASLRRARTCTAAPAGEWRTAFSSRLATTWCTRSGSPSAARPASSTCMSIATPGTLSSCSRTACASTGSIANAWRSSGTVPASRRERSRSCATSRPSRSTCVSIVWSVRGIGRGHTVDEVLERGLQRGERGPELVADVRDEVTAHAVGLGELRRHPVERDGEPSDLVVRGGGDTLVVVALGHRLGRLGHLAQRRRHAAGETRTNTSATTAATIPADARPEVQDADAEPEDEDGDADRADDETRELDLDRRQRVERTVGDVRHGWAALMRPPRQLDRVADAVHRADHVVAELAADRADVRVDGAHTGGDVVAPHLGEQVLTGEHLADGLGEEQRRGRTRSG